MIPIRDAVPARTRPIVTLALVAASAAVTLLFSLLQTGQLGTSALADIGRAGVAPGPVAWLLATLSLVRPSGWFQGVACAVALWLFGPTVEDRVGHGRFVVLYVGCAAAAAATVAAIGTLSATAVVLLPGAVGGVIGAHAALYPKARILVLIPVAHGLDVGDVPAVMVAGLWVVAQLGNSLTHNAMLSGWSPGLALVQLAAGIASGAAAAFLLKRPERMRVEWWNP
ncbi:MAG: rhomboid family intramembrane serine protease [Acidobacteria bacterium]|jgi:membrane associated rhomboid family serine protease|nr:rhomboid family intramembrane serine protease [Acidobacteriota bacterium]